MIKNRVLSLIAMLSLLLNLGVGGAAAQTPRTLLDWGKCGLRVARIEFTEKLTAGDQTLTAGRRDAVLALIKVEGAAPQDGELSVAPGSFGAQFTYRGVNRIELSKAWGIRGSNPESGETIEKWTADPDERANVGAKAGESVGMWFAVVLPREVRNFYVIVPTLIEAQVPGGQ